MARMSIPAEFAAAIKKRERNCQQKACSRPGNGNAKLGPRRLRLIRKPRQPAKRMQDYLDHRQILKPRHRHMRQFMQKDRRKEHQHHHKPEPPR